MGTDYGKKEAKVCLDIDRPSHGRSWPSVAPADTLGQADLSTFPVWPTCSMWSAMVGSSNSLLKLKSMLGYASGRHSFQSIQFTESCLPSHWIFLGCEPPIGIGVIAENVPAQSVRNRFAVRHPQQIRVGFICESVDSRIG